MTHQNIKLKDYNDYVERLQEKLFAAGRPLNGQIDITYNCNLKCQHCFIVRQKDREELSYKKVLGILDQIYEAGCLWLCFSGGEPFLREDFLDIYTYARKKGFLITIFTTATLITPEIADYLAKLPPYSIEVSLNGITQDVYEEVTQIEGSFTKAMQAIQLLKEKKLPLGLKTNGMKINQRQIIKIKEFSEKLLGKNYFRFDPVLYPRLDGSKKPCGLRLTTEEILQIQQSDNDMLCLCQEQFRHPDENMYSKQGYLFPCHLNFFHIDPYGRMRICSFMDEPSIDLNQEEFLPGFERLYQHLRKLKFKNNTECRNCKISYLCRQCPGRAMIENKDRESKVDFFCELAHRSNEVQTYGAISERKSVG